MQYIGIGILTILLLWLIFHKEKNQNDYSVGLATGFSYLPDIAKHYLI